MPYSNWLQENKQNQDNKNLMVQYCTNLLSWPEKDCYKTSYGGTKRLDC